LEAAVKCLLFPLCIYARTQSFSKYNSGKQYGVTDECRAVMESKMSVESVMRDNSKMEIIAIVLINLFIIGNRLAFSKYGICIDI
jgi:hypothetical protein